MTDTPDERASREEPQFERALPGSVPPSRDEPTREVQPDAPNEPLPDADDTSPEPSSEPQQEAQSDLDTPVEVAAAAEEARRKRVSGAGVVIGLLLALLGFALVVQVKSNSTDSTYASMREGDLVQIMSDLDASSLRLQQDITDLERTKRELQSGAAGQEAAQAAAKSRADDLGILAGTLQARGPGVQLRITEATGRIRAATLLNVVQELRGAGAEAIEIDGSGGAVRVIASTSFVESDGGIRVDGRRLTGPYTITAIGDPDTLYDGVSFPIGAVAKVKGDGGNVIVSKRDVVDIKEVRPDPVLEHARPVS